MRRKPQIKKKYLLVLMFGVMALLTISFKSITNSYTSVYNTRLNELKAEELTLISVIEKCDLNTPKGILQVRTGIQAARNKMKIADFWLRYLDPVDYKKINGPLPVEWETEVFEKFEKPYKRDGAGLTLAALYLDERTPNKDSLLHLIQSAVNATEIFGADSITKALNDRDHFLFCNRLFILNLAAIYSTGFECPDTTQIVPELRLMLSGVKEIYRSYNESYPDAPLTNEYITRYDKAIAFVNAQPASYSAFDHFTFIKDYVSPLFTLNQSLINRYNSITRSLVDYTLNKNVVPLFSKDLYRGQDSKGIFLRVKDSAALAEIDRLGKLLFYDPILSGNNERSCVSCHKPAQYFADTVDMASMQFNHKELLARNTPSLVNAQYNHLLMLDGKHISLQHQGKDVITNPKELGCDEKELMQKILSCKEYRNGFKELLKYTPQEPEISIEHIVSAVSFYYTKFSRFYSPFDEAMNHNTRLDATAKKGFNLFMSKAQCGTCHFVPQFNGTKPPFISTEFEVLGVPEDAGYKKLSADKGRHEINPATETMNAFRTGSIRNAEYTKPYMHNGVFRTLEEVVDFYDAGGGTGKGLKVANQTLSADSLKLTKPEKIELIAFIRSLNEKIEFDTPPQTLPASKIKALNNRKVGGTY